MATRAMRAYLALPLLLLLAGLIATSCAPSIDSPSSSGSASPGLPQLPSAVPGHGEVLSSFVAQRSTQTPLEEVLGFSSERSRRNQQLLTMQRRANEAVVRCMASAGFEYTPEPVNVSLLQGPRSGDATRAWVQVNGLGITTSLLELSQPETTRIDAAAANSAYAATLSPERSAAYDQALIGAASDAGAFAPDGCWGRAYAGPLRQLALLDELNEPLGVLNARVEADPRVRQLMAEWSSCMAGFGRTYDDRSLLVDDVFARLLAIEFVETDATIAFIDETEVDALLAFEIAVGLEDLTCRETIDADLGAIRADYEREFLTDHRTQLETLLTP